MKKYHIFRLALVLVISFTSFPVVAQVGTADESLPEDSAKVSVDKGPDDALGRGNPRGSIAGFLSAASELNWQKAAEYLDLRELPEDVDKVGGPELARQLNQVLSRAMWFDDYSVSDLATGVRGDGLPPNRDELTTIETSGGRIPVWLQQVPREDGAKIWKISNRSVARIPELYEEFSFSEPVEKIRHWFPEDISFLGLEAFKWFIILVVALLSWPPLYLLGWGLSRILSSSKNETYPLVKKIFTGPLVLIGILLVMSRTITELGAGAYAQEIMRGRTVSTLAVIWATWMTLTLLKTHQQAKLSAAGRPGAAKLMQPVTTLLKLLVLIVGLLFWLNNLGVNITTVLAGLGVGGLAVALALQRPIEDMMGALTIFTQATIKVGDLCRYGTELGVVEDIGLRTTRLRTLNNTVVSIPNSQIANQEIENLSSRQMIRYAPVLRLRYDTPVAVIREVTASILEALRRDGRVKDEPLRVRFTNFDEDAILIKVNCFIQTTDFNEFLEVAEELNIHIMELLHEAGARFALPGRVINLEGEPLSVFS